MSDIPVIHALDDDGESTGTVHPYCSLACREAGKAEVTPPYAETMDPLWCFGDGAVCEGCGRLLGEGTDATV
jgi:hypothetical protein